MNPSFVSKPPSNEFADATTRRFPPHVLHQAGANSLSERDTCSSGRCQYGSVRQRLKSPLVMQSPPTRTNIRKNICLTEPY